MKPQKTKEFQIDTQKLKELQKLLNHSDISVTKKYLGLFEKANHQ